MSKSILQVAAASVVLLAAGRAAATPRPLPFTYTTETLGQGELEVEQLADLTPVKGQTSTSESTVAYVAMQFQTEFEYGITDRLELGLYVVYVLAPTDIGLAAPMTETTGIKERLRYVFADPGRWPIDVGVYGEVVEGNTEEELEAKILLQRRIGNLRIASNLWAEYEFEFSGVSQKDIVLNPTLGATYEITPVVHAGVEGWLRVEFPNQAIHPRPYALGPAEYVGPTFMVDFGKLWWSAGVYARVSDVDHSMQPGEPYGPVWARTIIGLNL
jgi:hypothetical protein